MQRQTLVQHCINIIQMFCVYSGGRAPWPIMLVSYCQYAIRLQDQQASHPAEVIRVAIGAWASVAVGGPTLNQ